MFRKTLVWIVGAIIIVVLLANRAARLNAKWEDAMNNPKPALIPVTRS